MIPFGKDRLNFTESIGRSYSSLWKKKVNRRFYSFIGHRKISKSLQSSRRFLRKPPKNSQFETSQWIYGLCKHGKHFRTCALLYIIFALQLATHSVLSYWLFALKVKRFSNEINYSEFSSACQSPCESFPCQHGGTCRALYETDDYRCTCKQNYTGKSCEDGELLSLFSEFFRYFSRFQGTAASKALAHYSLRPTVSQL